MHGIGNDFVMIDAVRDVPDVTDFSALARATCDRKSGIGADGLIVLFKPKGLQMRMWNPDGSESEMCGNGLRCFARFAIEHGYEGESKFKVVTGAGTLGVEVRADVVRVQMGKARLTKKEIPMVGEPDETFVNQLIAGHCGTAVSMGNPHLVLFVDDVDQFALADVGPQLEHDPLFPNRTNVHVVQPFQDGLKMRSWERGAGLTLACGTGACAVAVAAKLNGLMAERAPVHLPGGTLILEASEDLSVTMEGPAETVFQGIWG